MNPLEDRIKCLEEENQALKQQLTTIDTDFFNNEQLNEILTYSKDVFVYISGNEQHAVKSVSGSISVFGYGPDDLMNGELSIRKFLHPEDFRITLETFRDKQKNKKRYSQELRILTKDKKEVWVSGVFIPVSRKNETGYLIKITDINRHKRNEEKLLDTNENLLTTLKSIGDSVIMLDPGGYIQQLNGAAEKLIGIINLKARNKHLSEILKLKLLPESESFVDLVELSFKTHKPVLFDKIFMQTPYQRYSVSCNLSPIIVKHRITGYIMTIKDLTDFFDLLQSVQESEKKLRENNALLNGIMHTIPAPLYVKNIRNEYIECNNAFLDMFGFTREQVIGNTPGRLFPKIIDDIEEVEKEVFETGKISETETKFETDHSVIESVIYRNLIYDQKEAPYGIVGVIVDIGNRKKMERELIAERDRLQAIGDNFPNGALFRFEIDLPTKNMYFSYFSKTWTRLTGLSIENSLYSPENVYSAIHPDDLPFLMDAINESATTMKSLNLELRYFFHGEVRWLQVSSHPHMEGGKILSDGFILDISDRKRIEKELDVYRKELEELVKNRTEELKSSNEELAATNEELFAINEEMAVTNDELYQKNNQLEEEMTARKLLMQELERYQNQLEQMVEQKTRELTESQQRLTSLSNNLPGGVIFQLRINFGKENVSLGELDLHFTFISDTLVDMLDITSETLLNDSNLLYRMIHPDDRDLFYAISITEDRDFRDLECRFILESGEIKWIHIRSVLSVLEKDHCVFEGFMLDITKRKKTELELEESRIRQAALIKILQIVQYSGNTDEAINAAFAEIGKFFNASRVYSSVKIAGGKMVRNNYEWCNDGIISEIDKLQNVPILHVQSWFDTFNSGKYICTSDIRNLAPETREILEPQGVKSILVLPLVNKGTIYGFIGVDECSYHREWSQREIDLLINLSQIISETLRRGWAEDALLQSEEMYRQLTVASPDAIIVCTPKRKVHYASPKALKIFGINEKSDIKNLDFGKLVHPHDKKQATDIFNRILRGEISLLPQLLMIRPDGTTFFGEISLAPVKNEEDRVTSVIMVIRDVTERKKSEIELVRAKEKAEESDKLKSAFLANMSHEIRTPVNGIIGFLNFLADDNLRPSRRQEYISIVKNSSTQLVKLIDDIIDVAKIEAQQMDIRPLPFRLNEFMHELHVFFDTYLKSNNKDKIVLLLDDSGFMDDCVIYVDPMRLRQILTNLIGNAIKFTDKGFIRFGYMPDGSNKLKFTVEDTGIGLEPGQKEIIFERFRQAEGASNRRFGGTGLGLTISKSLTQMMGGEMEVESTPKIGSTFCFTISYIPVNKKDEKLFDPETVRQPEIRENSISVLLVEPEIMKYNYYKTLLLAAGAHLLYARNAREWFDHINQSEPIDLVLADGNIFTRENEKNIQKIRTIRSGLPIVVISGKNDPGDEKLLKLCNCNANIQEPVTYEDMKQWINS